MLRQVTLTIDTEDFRYLLLHIHQDKHAWDIFTVAYLGKELAELVERAHALGITAEMIKAECQPDNDPDKLLDGWSSFEHKHFYRQAIRQANAILRETEKGDK